LSLTSKERDILKVQGILKEDSWVFDGSPAQPANTNVEVVIHSSKEIMFYFYTPGFSQGYKNVDVLIFEVVNNVDIRSSLKTNTIFIYLLKTNKYITNERL